MQRYPRFYCYIEKPGMNHLSGKLSFLAVLLYLTGCTKANSSSNQNASAGIAGKWGW